MKANSREILHKLEKIREKKGLSQGKFAKRLGVSRPTYNEYINGVSEPSNETLKEFYKYLIGEPEGLILTVEENDETYFYPDQILE